MSGTTYHSFTARLLLLVWIGFVSCQDTTIPTFAPTPSSSSEGSTEGGGEIEATSSTVSAPSTLPEGTSLSEETFPTMFSETPMDATETPMDATETPSTDTVGSSIPGILPQGTEAPSTDITDLSTPVEEESTPAAGSPVSVQVYYTSYCPRVAYFITRQLVPTYRRLMGYVDVKLVPYGMANETQLENGTWSFECCPKSPLNCFPDMLQTCAINILNSTDMYLPFISCLEMHPPWHRGGERCAWKLKVNYTELEDCTKSEQGNEWFHQMALETASLDPPLERIPRIVVNGASNRTIEMKAVKNLTRLVCEMLQEPKPMLCGRFSEMMTIDRMMNSLQR